VLPVQAVTRTWVFDKDMLRSARPKNQKKVIVPLRTRLNFGARYVKLYRMIVIDKLAMVATDIHNSCVNTSY
jgi:hypothetical protein